MVPVRHPLGPRQAVPAPAQAGGVPASGFGAGAGGVETPPSRCGVTDVPPSVPEPPSRPPAGGGIVTSPSAVHAPIPSMTPTVIATSAPAPRMNPLLR
jgi:hypothetical protein